MDELPVTRNSERDLSDLVAPASVDFEIISPLCLKSVTLATSGFPPAPLHGLLDKDAYREDLYSQAVMVGSAESLLLLSELPAPEEEGLYGKACTTNTGAVFREGDVVNLEFKLVEREPNCGSTNVYP